MFIIEKLIKQRRPTEEEMIKYNEEFEEKMKLIEEKSRAELRTVASTSVTAAASAEASRQTSGAGDLRIPTTLALSDDIASNLATTDIVSKEHRAARKKEIRRLKKAKKKKDAKIKRVETKQLLQLLQDEDEIAGFGKNGTLRHGMMLTGTQTGENGGGEVEMEKIDKNLAERDEYDDDNDDSGDEDSDTASESGGKGGDAPQEAQTNMDVITGKLNVFNEIRYRLVDNTFKFPAWFKYVNICLVVLWALACAIVTSLWCLWFDVVLDASNGYENDIISNCTGDYEGYDVSEKTFLNWNETQEWLDSINGTYMSVYNPPEGDSFDTIFGINADLTVSQRFMLATAISYLLAIFFWQPIILLLKSMWKLRSLMRNPDQLNEAILFYDANNLVNLDEIAKIQAASAAQQLRHSLRQNNLPKMEFVNTEDIEERAP